LSQKNVYRTISGNMVQLVTCGKTPPVFTVILQVHARLGERYFGYVGPLACNKLPADVFSYLYLKCFKTTRKTLVLNV